jgi:hypothetical protein
MGSEIFAPRLLHNFYKTFTQLLQDFCTTFALRFALPLTPPNTIEEVFIPLA